MVWDKAKEIQAEIDAANAAQDESKRAADENDQIFIQRLEEMSAKAAKQPTVSGRSLAGVFDVMRLQMQRVHNLDLEIRNKERLIRNLDVRIRLAEDRIEALERNA